MKKILLFILPVWLVACSSPKYVYHFDHYDYSSGKKSQVNKESITEGNESILDLGESVVVADGGNNIILKEERPSLINAGSEKSVATSETDHFADKMSKQERREFRREVKKELREMKRINSDVGQNVNNAEAMDKDLKLAIIFGAVGLTLSLFGGINAAFWVLGVIAIVVGVVFLVRWLLRQ